MNLNDYRIVPGNFGRGFKVIHKPTDAILLVTENVGVDTVMRVALEHDLKRHQN